LCHVITDLKVALSSTVGEKSVKEGIKRQRHGSSKNSSPLASVGTGNYFGASSEGFLKASSSYKRQVMR
jgi:hypothetical protein